MIELSDAAAALQVLRSATDLLDETVARAQTPCRDYDVAALADHLVNSITRISAAAGVAVATPDDDTVAARVIATGGAVLAGWQERGTAGEVSFTGRTMAAADLLGVIALEFVVHGWDFATAAGAKIVVADDLSEVLLALVHRTITPQSRRFAGFDEPVPTDRRAPVLDRLLAYTGRNPAHSRLRLRS